MTGHSTKPPSKSVFVGNIPYGLTEEQIIDIFSSAGKVLNFRLVYDRETGRPKGFGFAEYPDSDSASSAVRNLNDYEIMNRKLRVDFSNDGAEEPDNNAHHGQNNGPPPMNGMPFPPPPGGFPQGMPPMPGFPPQFMPPAGMQGFPPPPGGFPPAFPPNPTPGANNNAQATVLPPLPAGVDLPAGMTAPDAISRTLGTLPPQQLLDVLAQMKTLVATDPAAATELLRRAPQLSYAIFQALLLMGLVKADQLATVVETSAQQLAAGKAAAAPSPAIPHHAPPPQSYTPQGGYAPQQQAQQYAPPSGPPQQQAPPAQAPPAEADPNALIQQVLAMPQEIVDALPPAERQQIMALRAQFGGR